MGVIGLITRTDVTLTLTRDDHLAEVVLPENDRRRVGRDGTVYGDVIP